MLVSNDKNLVKEARFLATQLRDSALHYQHSVIGYNYRMSNVFAGIGRVQLEVLDNRVIASRAVFNRYLDVLGVFNELELMPELEHTLTDGLQHFR